jgi:hypothetical protein
MIVGIGASRARPLRAGQASGPAIGFIDDLDPIGRSRAALGPALALQPPILSDFLEDPRLEALLLRRQGADEGCLPASGDHHVSCVLESDMHLLGADVHSRSFVDVVAESRARAGR